MLSVLKTTWMYLKYYIDLLVELLFSLYWESEKKPIPPLKKEHGILKESASSLAKKIRQRELKSEDLVRAVIERIKEVNPILNAVTATRFDLALAEAKEVDLQIAASMTDEEFQKKPLLGVPFTSKENHAIKGVRSTLGLWERRNEVSQEDSVCIARLKAAGAIPVAVSNLPELLVWQECINPVFGRTNNPHHTGRSPGGSSGAEAALMSSYASIISLSSDIGGSTRIPAFYCGQFGHHPTPGHCNYKGVTLRAENDEASILNLGFISKKVEDMPILVKVIAGEKALGLNLDKHLDMKDINFYYLVSTEDPKVTMLRPAIKNIMQRVLSKIRTEVPSENSPKPYYHEAFNHMYDVWRYWLSKECDDYALMYTNFTGRPHWFVELVKKVCFMSHHCFSAIFQLILHQLMPAVDEQWAENITREAKEDLYAKLGNNGILLTPSCPNPAPYHYSCFFFPANTSYFLTLNWLRVPVTQVPIGVDSSSGMPIGIQVVAAPGNDGLCLTVAKYLEKEFGGAVMAAKVEQ